MTPATARAIMFWLLYAWLATLAGREGLRGLRQVVRGSGGGARQGWLRAAAALAGLAGLAWLVA